MVYMIYILSFIDYMYMKNKWIPWLHDKTNGNWHELTTIMYNIDKSRQTQNSKRERETTIENVFESMIITEKKENPVSDSYQYIYSYKKYMRNFCPLSEPDYYIKWDEEGILVSNDQLKSNCGFRTLGKFKI